MAVAVGVAVGVGVIVAVGVAPAVATALALRKTFCWQPSRLGVPRGLGKSLVKS